MQKRIGVRLQEQTEFIQLLRIIAKRKAIIVFGTFVCLLAAIVATAYMIPEYEASVRILVSQGQGMPSGQSIGDSYQGILMSERLTKTFSEMIASRTMAEQVIDALELSKVPDDLMKQVSADSVKDTQLIRITVTNTNPGRAKEIANTYAGKFIDMVGEVVPASAMISVKVVEQAATPVRPERPKPVLNILLALLVGLMISIGVAFLLEMLDVSVKEAEDVESLVGAPSLGRIPKAKTPLTLDSDNMLAAESFRSIRTNLQYMNFDQSIRKLVVSSPHMEEGKTTVASNLAVVFAQAGNKILLIDCDMRRPRIDKIFDRDAGRGLSNVLIGAASAESVIQTTDVPGLHVLTSGPIPPNPADLLSSERMNELLSSVEGSYDLIILDCPPVLVITDAAIVTSKADAVLLVSSFGKTKKADLVAAKDSLGKVGARIIGFVINNVRMSGKSGYYYYKPYVEHKTADQTTH